MYVGGKWQRIEGFFYFSLRAHWCARLAEHLHNRTRKCALLANVELVQIPVIVFDDKGGVATNLKKDDFRVLEDGVEQRLVYCERERESVSS